ncbi:hypothetical protein ACMD2_10943 [Ananas comosus]|uniref:Cryptochrome C-terminal domain-containing protein n=1 Tax=Ananas comosus TaxID=4615 RepID=A0A199UH70_ANACO|nr:hypothetical protein ACMD2_10943 [Ananas comosus]
MQQQEAASRAAVENGTEEGLGDSSELPMIDLPQRDPNGGNNGEDSRPEVPSNVDFETQPEREDIGQAVDETVRNNVTQHFSPTRIRGAVYSTLETSSSWTARDGGVVHVWSRPTTSSRSGHFVADETAVINNTKYSITCKLHNATLEIILFRNGKQSPALFS